VGPTEGMPRGCRGTAQGLTGVQKILYDSTKGILGEGMETNGLRKNLGKYQIVCSYKAKIQLITWLEVALGSSQVFSILSRFIRIHSVLDASTGFRNILAQ
jgi:hypothetical protein